MILPCLCGVLLNLLGIAFSGDLAHNIFLNSLGTIFVSALGGYLPGSLVAFATMILCGIFDPVLLDYGIIGIIISLCASYFSKKGLFEKWSSIIVLILFFTIFNMTAWMGLRTLFYRYELAAPTSPSELTSLIFEITHFDLLISDYIAFFILDLLDKTVSVIFTALALKYLPNRIKNLFEAANWKQNQLSLKNFAKINQAKVRKISLRVKVPVFLGIIMTLVVIASTYSAYSLYLDYTIKNHTELGQSVAKMAVSVVKPQFVNRYLETHYKTNSYLRTQNSLEAILKSSPEIKYIYVYKILEDGCHVVFDLDPEGSELGDIEDFDESFKEQIPNLLAGKSIPPKITDDTYGWLLTVYEPVFDENGICQCYVGVDIAMDRIKTEAYYFWGKILLAFIGFFIILSIYGHSFAEYNFTLPINAMATESANFAYDTQEERANTLKVIQDLDIKTGDEIENLYFALTKMTSDAMNYINDLQHKNAVIEKMQRGLILVMAELVESRDKNTGDHVRKTSGYVRIIANQMKKEGIYKDSMTDEFINEVVKSAPLHDIGKIHIPDAILNKPGKLTDSEFDLMKTHTTIGREIIDNVIKIVPDPGYLKEARNLAAYHHEKWNGLGYPEGLKGNEIPLSARIMAVADVFDALVSKRSYKDGFPFEKAIAIIREGIGNHFDPEVVKAFLDAENEVKDVMNNNLSLIL